MTTVASEKTQSDTQLAKPVGSSLAPVDAPMAPVYIRFTPAQIEAAAIAELEQQEAINSVLRDKVLKRDHDYGPSDMRSPKNTLLKPGAEKLIRFFKTHVRFEADNELHAQFGNRSDLVCMKCQIIDNATSQVLGEGRGSCLVGPQGRDENKATKQAEKRAVVDACLYTFCLSEFFTQDMEEGAFTAKAALIDRKRKLIEQAEEYRKGVDTSLTARLWINEITKATYQGRKSLYTIGECDEVFSLFGNFDKASGVRIGGRSEPAAMAATEPNASQEPVAETAADLTRAKKGLLSVVKKARADIKNDLSDGDFVVMLVQAEYDGRDKLQSVDECKHIEDVLEDYNFRTGKKVAE